MLNTHKKFTKAPIAAAIIAAVGLSSAVTAAHALTLADGNYTIYINATPSSGGVYLFGTDGFWSSSFTFGGNAPNTSSNPMTDETSDRHTVLGSDGISRGTGIVGDGYVGKIGITVSSGAITFTSFSKDLILNTAGGDFVQLYSDVATGPDSSVAVTGAGGTGTITSATSAMTLTLTGRKGAIGAPNNLYNERWNVDTKCGTGLGNFTTGSVSTRNTDCTIKNTITGKTITSYAADQNADGLTDYKAILVSGGTIGSDWASFEGANYFEVWNVKILSGGTGAAATNDTTAGNATSTATTPDSLNSFGSTSQGCSISPIARNSTAGGEWWLVAGFLAWLGVFRRWFKKPSRA